MSLDPASLMQNAMLWAETAGRDALDMQHRLRDIRFKGEKDLVTEADVHCDKTIRAAIQAAYPDHNLLTEEEGALDKGGELTWLVDPIDGTINYSRGLPLWGVSIGVARGDTMVAGAAYLPATGEMYSAFRGGGAWLNGKPIRVSPRDLLADAILSHGDFNVGPDPQARDALNDEVRTARLHLAAAVQRLKCLGSAVVEGAYVAAGRFEGYCMVTLKPWDVAVTSLLVEEAGGKVTDLHGRAWNTRRESALFSNGILHSELLQALDWDARRAPPA